MTRKILHKSLTAVVGLAIGVVLINAPSHAQQFDRRFKQNKSQNFQIVAPKSERNTQVPTLLPIKNDLGAKVVAPKSDRSAFRFRAPKADRGQGSGGLGGTAQFAPPKADRGSKGPVVFSLPPKSVRGNNGTAIEFAAPKAPRGDAGRTTAEFVAPKAPRRDDRVFADAKPPKFSSPQLLAPADPAPQAAKGERTQSAPLPVAEADLEQAPVSAREGSDAAAPGKVLAASEEDIALAHYRAAQRYGYGEYGYADHDGSYDEGSYEDYHGSSYGSSYGDDGCH